MKNTELRTGKYSGPLPAQAHADTDDFELNMSEVESHDMPSIATSGWEITSILVILILLLGVLYKHNV